MENTKDIAIYEEGKIDIHKRNDQLQRILYRLINDNTINQENKSLILKFIQDCQLGKTIKGKSKKKIGHARCLKYISILLKISEYMEKSFNKITQNDMEKFISRLESDVYQSRFHKPYGEETKCDYKKTIKKFWKWKDGNNQKYPELVDWIDTYSSIKDVPALTRDEVEKMVECAANYRDRALLMVLFDSGARIEELLNVRLKKEHLFWKDTIKCYMIRLEFSKTKPRTISLPLCTEYINKWLEVHPAKDNSQAQLFPLTYCNLKKIINRIGKKVLDKKVSPHLLRHSSATFYANRLNRYQLCYRYGWAMSSKQVDRYLDREGIFDKSTAEIVRTDEIIKTSECNRSLKEELAIVKESYLELTSKYDILRQKFDSMMEGKYSMTLLLSLAKQQQKMSDALEKISGLKFDVVLPERIISQN